MVTGIEPRTLITRTRATFGIRIDFSREEGDPSRVFVAMSELIKACQDIDRKLVKSIQVEIEPVLLLEDIERRSLIAWLRSVIKLPSNAPDLGLDSEKVSRYLSESKYIIVDHLNDTTTLTNSALSEIQMQMFEILQKENPTPDFPVHVPMPKRDLISGIQQFQSALSPLSENNDQAEYLTADNRKAAFNLSLQVTPDSIEELLVSETLAYTASMLLKIKKPDYLGSSQWEFRHGAKNIPVKFTDFSWLDRFHKREIILAPGDSLKANVEVITKYDIDSVIISTSYTLLEVIEVIPAPKPSQLLISQNEEESQNLENEEN